MTLTGTNDINYRLNVKFNGDFYIAVLDYAIRKGIWKTEYFVVREKLAPILQELKANYKLKLNLKSIKDKAHAQFKLQQSWDGLNNELQNRVVAITGWSKNYIKKVLDNGGENLSDTSQLNQAITQALSENTITKK